MNNRTTPWPPKEQASRNTLNSGPRRPTTPTIAQKPPGGETPGLSSSPALYSLSPMSLNAENGLEFVGPCFVCQLVGHRAADCPKRRCYLCGQTGHMARTCPSRPAPRDIQCQGGCDHTRMSELPYLGRSVGKRHSQDVMGPHTSCAVDNPGREGNAEVKMVLLHPEPVSRPREQQVMSSPAKNSETKEESSTMITKVEESGEEDNNKTNWLPSSSENEC